LRQISGIVEGVIDGRTNVAAFAIGGGTLAVILLLKRWPRVPGLLIAVVAAMLVVAMWDLDTSAHVVVLGPLPPGLPALRMPVVHASDLMKVITGGLAVALVSFAGTMLSRTRGAPVRRLIPTRR
jgi:MFS superfamily sulfate permease-like transporter